MCLYYFYIFMIYPTTSKLYKNIITTDISCYLKDFQYQIDIPNKILLF